MHDQIIKFNALHKVNFKRSCQCESQYVHRDEHELIACADARLSQYEYHSSELRSVH